MMNPIWRYVIFRPGVWPSYYWAMSHKDARDQTSFFKSDTKIEIQKKVDGNWVTVWAQ